jgi:type VI protein secretion system component Hcp
MWAMEGKGRAARVLLAGLVALLGSAASRPASAASTLTLTLTPTQGVATSAFSMTFTDRDPLGLICPGGTVTFSWDNPSRTLATAPLGGPNCTATASAQTPAGSAPGAHAVMARSNPLSATATYQVVATPSPTPRPTPTRPPTRRPTPTPVPTPTPPPTPEPTPVVLPPPPPCDTRVPQATGTAGYLEVAGIAGGVAERQHAGAVLIGSLLPTAMLPPALGTVPLTEVELTRAPDGASAALLRAVSTGTHFDCVQLELGPGGEYLYATYAFHDAIFSTYTPADGGERLTLTYVSVDWEYQLRDGSPVAAGRGNLGDTPHPRPMQPAGMARGPVMVVLGLFAVGGATGGAVLGVRWWRRRRRDPGEWNPDDR